MTMTKPEAPAAGTPDLPETAELHVGERVFTLPVEHAVAGQSAVNIGALLKDAKLTTLDYGYANTAPTRSAITYSTATRASCAIAATPSSSWRIAPRSSRPRTC
jgi:hypothetical protein